MWFLFVCACAEICVCMLTYFTVSKCVFIQSSHPQCPGIKQKEGWEVRSGAATTFPSPRHSVILWARQTNRPSPRARWAQQGGIARSEYSLGQDRMGWQAPDRCSSLFSPQKTRTITNREMPWQLGYGVTGRGLFIQGNPATFVNSATQEHTHGHKYASTHAKFLTFDRPQNFYGCSITMVTVSTVCPTSSVISTRNI